MNTDATSTPGRAVLVRLGVVIGLMAGALGARLALDPLLGQQLPFAALFIPVAVIAYHLGVRWAAGGAILGGVGAKWFLLAPERTFSFESREVLLALVGYFFVAAVIVALGNVARIAQLRAATRAAELEREVAIRTSAEQAVRDSEARHRALFEHLPDAVFITMPDGTILDANPAASSMFGASREELIRAGRSGLVDASDEERLMAALDQRKRTGGYQNVELLHVRSNGERFTAEASSVVLNATSLKAFVVLRDITERKLAEDLLRQSHEQLEQRVRERTAELRAAGEKLVSERQRFLEILDTLPVIVTLLRPDYRVEWCNRAYRKALGENAGRLCYHSQFGRDAPCVECQAFNPLVTGEPQHWEWTLPNGRTFDIHNYALTEPDGSQLILEMDLDITERRQAEAALKDLNQNLERAVAERTSELRVSEELLRAVTDNSPDAIYVKDRESRLLMANPALLRLLGLTAGEALGKTDLEVHRDPLIGRAIIENDRRVMERGEPEAFEEVIPTHGGDRTFLSIKAPRRDSEGRVIGIVGISRDITDRKQFERELQHSTDVLREADRKKNEFIAMLSHELRNPLAPIRNSVYVLNKVGGLNERGRQAATVIDRQVNHLTRLVEDLLDVTRITRGKVRLQRERVELCGLVQRTVDDHRSLFITAGTSLEVSGCSGPIYVDGDPTRLAQIVGNLLTNAAKFTPRGRVEVSVAREGENAVVRVCDDGAGISSNLLETLFEPFVQADATLDRSKGGLGLGLALVKGLADLHGGRVIASSEGQGKGSQFCVEIPVLLQAVDAEAADACHGPRVSAS